MNCVFVYSGGQVGLRELPAGIAQAQNYRTVRPVSMLVGVSPAPERLDASYDVYNSRGRMFDGRPIFCADGFDVKEAVMQVLVTKEEDPQEAESRCLAEARRFVKRTYLEFSVLDSWSGEISLTEDERFIFDTQQVSKRGARLLVAVRS